MSVPVVRRPPVALLAVIVALAVAGCAGGEHPLHATTEGPYLDLGALHYQVQLSRQLNPADVEDHGYLEGLTPAQARLRPDQSWFGVWMRVENHGRRPLTPALDFRVTDTQGAVYTPVVPDATNPFAYRTTPIGGNRQEPDPASVAFNSPTGGVLVLFKVARVSFDNRPLELSISDPAVGKTGVVDLDV